MHGDDFLRLEDSSGARERRRWFATMELELRECSIESGELVGLFVIGNKAHIVHQRASS